MPRDDKGRFTKGVFDFDSLTPNLKRLLPVVDAAVDLAFDTYGPIAETWMRDNAKWTDRTSNARNGLQSAHNKEDMVFHELVLFHTMPYGLWLEVRWSGKYAIIGPAMLHIAPLLTERCVTTIDYAIGRLPK